MKKRILVGLLMVALLLPLPSVWANTTVTFYSTASDGYIYESDVTYNVPWTAETGHIGPLDDWCDIGQSSYSSYYIYRSFFFFDTSSIPNDATILSATLSLYTFDTLPDNDFNVTIQNGQPTYPHDPLVTGDYNKEHYSGNGGKADTSGWYLDRYNDITLNVVGMGWINKAGTTKLCLRSSKDISGTSPPVAPPDVSNKVVVRPHEGGAGYIPKLVVTYMVPPAGEAAGDAMKEAALAAATVMTIFVLIWGISGQGELNDIVAYLVMIAVILLIANVVGNMG